MFGNNGIDESREKKTIEARSFYRTSLYIHMNKLKLRKRLSFGFFFDLVQQIEKIKSNLRKKRKNRLNLIVSFNLIRKLLELLNQNNKK